MAIRFWRRFKIAPGLHVNLSKSGASLSFGPRGAKFTVGPRGTRKSVGIPGTGLFWYEEKRWPKGQTQTVAVSSPPPPEVRPADRLTLGFFQRLAVSKDEEGFVDGCRCMVTGDEEVAYRHLRSAAAGQPDAAFLAGVLALKRERYDEAGQQLRRALEGAAGLRQLFGKYGVDAHVSFPVTEEVTALADADRRGVLLLLTEVYQAQGQLEEAARCLEDLRSDGLDDPVLRLSLVELLVELGRHREAVDAARGTPNDSAIHAATLLYQAVALRHLGLNTAAGEILGNALRHTEDRPEELLRELRYQLALVHEAEGKAASARRELEQLFAEDPNYKDVGERLGVKK